jgi:CBS domain-containing protein
MMELADILTRERIRIPLQAEGLEDGVRILLDTVDPTGELGGDPHDLLDRLRSGDGGYVLSPTPRSWIGIFRAGTGTAAALGVSSDPLEGEDGAFRILFLLRIGHRTRLRDQGIQALSEVLGSPQVEGALLTARSAEEVRSLKALMRVALVSRLRVRDALTPLTYRIYPDTPLHEVVDLMARKGLSALPVVGEGLQVLGVVTAGQALRQSLQGIVREADRVGMTARDVMSRSVLCVTEDQALEDAAQVMVNRDTAQLPVVREGEMVGFLTREAVLRALFTEEPTG